MTLIHSVFRFPVQETPWVDKPVSRNSNQPALAMDHDSRRSQGASCESRRVELWRRLMNALFYMLETVRRQFVMLARAELGTKRSKKSAMKQLEHPGHAQGTCLHPAARVISRSNQYADWTVCGQCSARLTYHSRRQSGRGRATAVSTSADAMYQAPPKCRQRQAREHEA